MATKNHNDGCDDSYSNISIEMVDGPAEIEITDYAVVGDEKVAWLGGESTLQTLLEEDEQKYMRVIAYTLAKMGEFDEYVEEVVVQYTCFDRKMVEGRIVKILPGGTKFGIDFVVKVQEEFFDGDNDE